MFNSLKGFVSRPYVRSSLGVKVHVMSEKGEGEIQTQICHGRIFGFRVVYQAIHDRSYCCASYQ